MALRFIESFDDGNTTTLGGQKWSSFNSSLAVGTTNARNGNSCKATNMNQTFSKTIDNQGTWIIGFAFRADSLPGGRNLIRLIDNSTAQCSLNLNSDGTLQVVNGSSTTLDSSAKSSNSLLSSTWYYIEWKVTIADSISAHTCKVNVNGANWIDVNSGQDLKAGSNTTANVIQFLDGSNSSATVYYDDIYILDGTGSAPVNDFLGDCKVECLRPTGAGNSAQFTPDSGSNYARVNETNSDGDTSYVETSTANNIDSYAFGDLTVTPTTIFGIMFNIRSRKTDAGTRTVAPLVRMSSTNYLGSNFNLTDTFADNTQIMTNRPSDSAAWTATDINNAEFGYKLIA